jgi:uncharacterized damage-inducible protein DinB
MDRALDSTLLHTLRLRLTEDYPTQIRTCIDVLTDDQVWWRPNDRSNAVGNLVLHLAGSNHFYLDHAIGGRPLDRDRESEFTARSTVRNQALIELWSASVQMTTEIVTSLSASQMVEQTTRTGKPTTIAQILLHVSHHNAAHMGQIVWITKLLREGALDDLWMKMRTK